MGTMTGSGTAATTDGANGRGCLVASIIRIRHTVAYHNCKREARSYGKMCVYIYK